MRNIRTSMGISLALVVALVVPAIAQNQQMDRPDQPAQRQTDRDRLDQTQTDRDRMDRTQTDRDRLDQMQRDQRQQPGQMQSDQMRDQARRRMGQRQLNDQSISQAVQRELQSDQGIQAQDLNVTATAGTIRLQGTVHSAAAKERAIRQAETVRGVRHVNADQLKVQPRQQISQQQLEQDIHQALEDEGFAKDQRPQMQIQDGVVTLRGEVESDRQRRQMAQTIRNIEGVKEVKTEQLSLKQTQQRDQEQIKQDIQQALRWDRRVDDQQIKIDVNDNQVQLSGTVGSAAERRRAGETAFVPGVQQVDVSNLQVDPMAQRQELRGQKYSRKDDQQLQQAAEKRMQQDRQLSQVQVRSRGGEVTLQGQVPSRQAKMQAENAIRDIVGVNKVNNELQVSQRQQQGQTGQPGQMGQQGQPQQQLSKDEIKNRVEQALRRDPYVDPDDVDIEVQDDRVVVLTGDVGTYFQKGRADRAAGQISGVQDVRNQLKVQASDQPLTYDPYVDDTYVYESDWYDYEQPQQARQGQQGQTDQQAGRQGARATDEVLAEEIREEMWWSPFVDQDDVNVSVSNGVATLTGTVEDWSERDAAVENAYEGGASWVVDQLTVADND